MKAIIKSIGSGTLAFASIAAIWMWGYTVGDNQRLVLTEYISKERDTLKSQITKLSSENNSLKYQLIRKLPTNQEVVENKILPKPTDSKDNSNILAKTGILSEEIYISEEDTKSVFNGAIEITLIGINYSGDPLRHKVNASILIPGGKSLKIENADPGASFKIGDYEILISQSSTFSASFKVFKIKTSQKF
jgi:hypothetical protein